MIFKEYVFEIDYVVIYFLKKALQLEIRQNKVAFEHVSR